MNFNNVEIERAIVSLRKFLDAVTKLIEHHNKEFERKEEERKQKEETKECIEEGICPDCSGKLLIVAEKENTWICSECKRYIYI